jgi:hypothetical protein
LSRRRSTSKSPAGIPATGHPAVVCAARETGEGENGARVYREPAGGFWSSDACGRPSDSHPRRSTAMNGLQPFGPVVAHEGVGAGPFWWPSHSLLGLRPRRMREDRPWTVFSRGSKRKGSAQYVLWIVLIFSEAYMYDSLMNYV